MCYDYRGTISPSQTRGAFSYVGADMELSQGTMDVLAALVIYDAGRLLLTLALRALRDRLRDGGR